MVNLFFIIAGLAGPLLRALHGRVCHKPEIVTVNRKVSVVCVADVGELPIRLFRVLTLP